MLNQLTEARYTGLVPIDDYMHSIAASLRRIADPDDVSPEEWMMKYFPHIKQFAEHHKDMLDWAWEIEHGKPLRPFVAIWPRGGGKTALAMMVIISLLCRSKRSYILYCTRTQSRTDERVLGIGSTLVENGIIARDFPGLCDRAVSRFGHSKGWRRNRLVTTSGAMIDGVGLDVAIRGITFEGKRPDLIVIDDIDAATDTKNRIEKNIRTLTDAIFPCGDESAAVLAVQNLSVYDGVFYRLAHGNAEYLLNRQVSGPIPAIYDLKVSRERSDNGTIATKIVGGTPSWPECQGIEECQHRINTFTHKTFLTEMQHEVHRIGSFLFRQSIIDRFRVEKWPKDGFVEVAVGIDPSGGKAEIGIIAAGLAGDGRAYVLEDTTQPASLGARNWYCKSASITAKYNGIAVAEKNFGGNMVTTGIMDYAQMMGMDIRIITISSAIRKTLRAAPIAARYEDGYVSHVGNFPDLEQEMTTWTEGSDPSPNRVDALVFALNYLLFPEHRSSAELLPPGWY